MKNIDVIKAFTARETAKSTNLWTTGNYIVNYSTTLAQYGDGEIIVNMTKYSTSTSTIQNKLLAELTYEYGKGYIRVVTGIERATKELS
jgi:hypothetical protein